MSKRRFVIQEHTVRAAEVHYDLMIESTGSLVTFQLETPPGDAATSATRSFDHRLLYLDYEGEISDERGHVEIWDRGHVEDVQGTPRDSAYRGDFQGDRLRGCFEIRATEDCLHFVRVT